MQEMIDERFTASRLGQQHHTAKILVTSLLIISNTILVFTIHHQNGRYLRKQLNALDSVLTVTGSNFDLTENGFFSSNHRIYH